MQSKGFGSLKSDIFKDLILEVVGGVEALR